MNRCTRSSGPCGRDKWLQGNVCPRGHHAFNAYCLRDEKVDMQDIRRRGFEQVSRIPRAVTITWMGMARPLLPTSTPSISR